MRARFYVAGFCSLKPSPFSRSDLKVCRDSYRFWTGTDERHTLLGPVCIQSSGEENRTIGEDSTLAPCHTVPELVDLPLSVLFSTGELRHLYLTLAFSCSDRYCHVPNSWYEFVCILMDTAESACRRFALHLNGIVRSRIYRILASVRIRDVLYVDLIESHLDSDSSCLLTIIDEYEFPLLAFWQLTEKLIFFFLSRTFPT